METNNPETQSQEFGLELNLSKMDYGLELNEEFDFSIGEF